MIEKTSKKTTLLNRISNRHKKAVTELKNDPAVNEVWVLLDWFLTKLAGLFKILCKLIWLLTFTLLASIIEGIYAGVTKFFKEMSK